MLLSGGPPAGHHGRAGAVGKKGGMVGRAAEISRALPAKEGILRDRRSRERQSACRLLPRSTMDSIVRFL